MSRDRCLMDAEYKNTTCICTLQQLLNAIHVYTSQSNAHVPRSRKYGGHHTMYIVNLYVRVYHISHVDSKLIKAKRLHSCKFFRVSYAYIVLRIIYVRSTAAAMHRGRCTWLCRNLKSTQPLLMAIVYSRMVHPRASCTESSFSTMDSRYEGPC
jgi:hypothetical protein